MGGWGDVLKFRWAIGGPAQTLSHPRPASCHTVVHNGGVPNLFRKFANAKRHYEAQQKDKKKAGNGGICRMQEATLGGKVGPITGERAGGGGGWHKSSVSGGGGVNLIGLRDYLKERQ